MTGNPPPRPSKRPTNNRQMFVKIAGRVPVVDMRADPAIGGEGQHTSALKGPWPRAEARLETPHQHAAAGVAETIVNDETDRTDGLEHMGENGQHGGAPKNFLKRVFEAHVGAQILGELGQVFGVEPRQHVTIAIDRRHFATIPRVIRKNSPAGNIRNNFMIHAKR